MRDVVADRMTSDVVVAHPALALDEAVRLMKLNKIRHLCIVSAGGHLVGVLSDRDISRALPSALSENSGSEFTRIMEMTRVGHIMTRAPVVVSSTTPIGRAAVLMRDHRIDALPVVDRGQLVGILTTTDCLGALALTEPSQDAPQSAA